MATPDVNHENVRKAVDFLLSQYVPLESKEDERDLVQLLNSLLDGETGPKAKFTAFSSEGGVWKATAAANADLPQEDLDEWCVAMQEYLEHRVIIEPRRPRVKLVHPKD